MGYINWMKSMADKLDWYDFGILKLGVFTFTLALAKLWPPILNLDWYWYGIVFIIAWVWLLFKIFSKQKSPEVSN